MKSAADIATNAIARAAVKDIVIPSECHMGADRTVLSCPLCGAFASEPCKWPADKE